MILKNKTGKERQFKLVLSIKKANKQYLVYKDIISGKIYAGQKCDNILKHLEEEERNMLNKVVERIMG